MVFFFSAGRATASAKTARVIVFKETGGDLLQGRVGSRQPKGVGLFLFFSFSLYRGIFTFGSWEREERGASDAMRRYATIDAPSRVIPRLRFQLDDDIADALGQSFDVETATRALLIKRDDCCLLCPTVLRRRQINEMRPARQRGCSDWQPRGCCFRDARPLRWATAGRPL